MSAATARLNDDSSEDEDDRLTRELASLELDDDLPDSIDTPDPETATIKDFQKVRFTIYYCRTPRSSQSYLQQACNELQMQNAELRRRVRSLVIEVGKMEAATGNSGGKSKRKKRVEIPPEFIQHGDDIHAVGRKAVYALHLWIDPAWFVYRRMPDINYKNPIVRWESLASQQKSMAAETWQYIKNESEQTVFDLTSLMGRHKWFGQVVSRILHMARGAFEAPTYNLTDKEGRTGLEEQALAQYQGRYPLWHTRSCRPRRSFPRTLSGSQA